MIKPLLSGIVFALLMIFIGIYSGFLTLSNQFATILSAVSQLWLALGGSIYFFIATAIFYIYSLKYLDNALISRDYIETQDALERLSLASNIFLGIGVIYTAVGMQSALVSAIGVDSDALKQMGAWDVLSRLVNGGMLTALTTTIVGGVGGYIMRTIQQLLYGRKLLIFQNEIQRQEYSLMLDRFDFLLERQDKIIDILKDKK